VFIFLLLRFGWWVKIMLLDVSTSAEFITNDIEASGELSKYQAPEHSWLKHYGTSRKFEGSIPGEF
jgi:hypothetical protein